MNDVIELPASRMEEAVDVLCDAFHDYPVMRYGIGAEGDDYDRRLRRLVHLFVWARVLRHHPILAIEDGGTVVAVATVTPRGDHPPVPEFEGAREAVWADLGAAARARYEHLVGVWQRLEVPEPHVHLNMLGTARSHAGRGYGRRLLDAVQEISRRDPESPGVSLTTEDPENVPLYEHCGYRVLHHARVTDALETWVLFRDDAAAAR
jgi:GNAT superfamily N-acetyltransferase